jgi:DNA polymerase-3 subunit delta'
MPWPEPAVAQSWLVAQGVPESDAVVLLRAAGGRPTDALRLARSGRSPKAWALLPKAMQRGDVGALADHAPAQAIDALQKVCHDLMAIGQGAAPRFFAEVDMPAVPSTLALARWSKSLANAAKTADHPFNAGLMLEALVSEARTTLNSAG